MSAGNSNTIYSVPDPETPNTTPSNGTLNSDHVVIDVEQKPLTKGREKVFGDVKVLHVKQSRYADYLIRELQVSRPKTPSPRSPAKEKACPIYQNTLIEDIEPEESELEREVRPVFQYHFIVWKDFQAPEYPYSILKFIKRLNEDYSPERGPILVHCSAGVGRTGSLVAIDSLLQQIDEEGCVSIFNTIADLRHQRNFLVQSLKQYIFVYRSLMEYVQFGDTEVEAFKLADHLETLKRTDSESGSKCLLEQEFERLSLVIEERKPCTVSSSDECTSRNRNQAVIPYDRNRVILVPVPHKEQSTYINASFIESYENRESFIVTQDPLESTMYDFWRMVVGHEISTIVMLSDFEVDDSSCPRYWPEDNQEVTFECVTVKHTHTSTKPVYIKRDFLVTNTKTREEIKTSQLQYLAWPSEGDENCVPDPSQLETFVQFAIDSLALHERLPNPGPMCVHCSTGSIRSSVLLALCILIQQARVEGRVDVFNVVRKLRSQRPAMISHYNHYKFVYEAISSYVSTYPQDLC